MVVQVANGNDTLRFDRVFIQESERHSITAIAQDNSGFMWFGTNNGLYRYDGFSYEPFSNLSEDNKTISQNAVSSMCVDNRGIIWIAGDSEFIDRLDPGDMSSERIELLELRELESRNNSVKDLIKSERNRIWILTIWGDLLRLDTNTNRIQQLAFVLEDIDNLIITDVVEDQDSALWIVFNESTVAKFDDRDIANLNRISIQRSLNLPSEIGQISLCSGDIGIVALAGNGSLFEFNSDCTEYREVTNILNESTGNGFGSIAGLHIDSVNNLWIGTNTLGLFKYGLENGRLNNFRHDPLISQSISNNQIESIEEDRSGVIWVGTARGLNKYSRFKHKFNHHLKNERSDGSKNYLVAAILEEDTSTVWLGTIGSGLIKYDLITSNSTNYPVGNGAKNYSDSVLALCMSKDGDLLVGTQENGLLLFDRSTGNFEPRSEPQQVNDILIDTSGTIWIATDINGLGNYVESEETFNYWDLSVIGKTEEGISGIKVLHEDSQGNLWIGTDGNGMIKLLPDRVNYFHYHHLDDDQNSLSDNSVYSILEDQNGSIWIGTHNGLNRLDPNQNLFSRFYQSDQLPDNVICGILEDESGALWLSTYNGLCRFDPASGRCNNYDISDGLQDNEFLPGSIHESAGGRFYFGGVKGFNEFFPGALELNSVKPNIVFTSIITPYSNESDGTSASSLSELRLPYESSVIFLEFAALDYVDPLKNQYAYMLEGVDKDWIYTGNQHTVRYSRLEPGSYTFRVKASNNDGIWNEEGTSLRLNIIPPFWARIEFRIFLVLLIAGFVFALFKWRTHAIERQRNLLQKEVNERRIAEARLLTHQERLRTLATQLTLAEEKERKRIATALHDDIGHSLVSTLVHIEARIKKSEEDEQDAGLEKIVTTLENTLQKTRALTVEVSPPSLYQFGIQAAAEGLVERFSEEFNIKSIISINEDMPLSEQNSIFLYQILRELLINVLKHAKASTIQLTIRPENDMVCLTLKDDGVGFNTEKVFSEEDGGAGYGLFSIKERLQSINGKLEITSQPGKGTETRACVPSIKKDG